MMLEEVKAWTAPMGTKIESCYGTQPPLYLVITLSGVVVEFNREIHRVLLVLLWPFIPSWIRSGRIYLVT